MNSMTPNGPPKFAACRSVADPITRFVNEQIDDPNPPHPVLVPPQALPGPVGQPEEMEPASTAVDERPFRQYRAVGGDVVTFCDECEHSDRIGPPWQWLCRQHERHESFGFVTQTIWDKFSPFLRCNDVNGGMCKLFNPEKEKSE